MTKFDDKVVVVTGAAGALERAVTEKFESLGATVVPLDIVEMPNGIHCDLFQPDSCAAAAAILLARHGRIDVLANVAGGFAMGTMVHETTVETWSLMHNLNSGSVVNMARALVPSMIAAANGKIINVAARAGLHGAATMGAYVASKSAVIRLT